MTGLVYKRSSHMALGSRIHYRWCYETLLKEKMKTNSICKRGKVCVLALNLPVANYVRVKLLAQEHNADDPGQGSSPTQ